MDLFSKPEKEKKNGKKLREKSENRLVYRSNVEVTFGDVYNYLAHITNDETVSLHYSVNGTYVPITTTGQLHTFIRLVHNDPHALLYVENHDYVWNVSPQSKNRKMAKRNANTCAADAENGEDMSMSDEESQLDDETVEENSQDEEDNDSADYDEDQDVEDEDVGDEEDEEEEEDREEMQATRIATLADQLTRRLISGRMTDTEESTAKVSPKNKTASEATSSSTPSGATPY
uniref:Uncharacterized protein n=1 Tax=Caenorhabditis japonica TaxID=281687 RepID=A0A8R1IBU0_CAEJA